MKKLMRLNSIFFLSTFSLLSVFDGRALAIDLEESLRAGIESSLELSSARQNWIATRETIATSTSTSDLSMSFSSTGSASETDSGSGFKSSNTYSNSITLSKNLYDGGQTRENIQLAQINLTSASASYLSVEQGVILATAEAYLNVIKARKEVKLHLANLERLKVHFRATKIRVEEGADTNTSLGEAQARLARSESDTILAKTQLSNANDMFQSLTNIDAILIKNSLQFSKIRHNFPNDLLDVEDLAKRNHPSVLTAIANEKAAAQGFKTLNATLKPTLALSLSATDAKSKEELKGSLTFTSKLFMTSSSRASARRTSALHSQSKHDLREAKRSAGIEAKTAYRNWKTNNITLAAVRSELDASRLVAKGVTSEAEFGQKTILDVLDAEKDVRDVELRLVSTEHEQILSQFSLHAATGNLTINSLGLDSALEELTSEPRPQNPLSSLLPFNSKTLKF